MVSVNCLHYANPAFLERIASKFIVARDPFRQRQEATGATNGPFLLVVQ